MRSFSDYGESMLEGKIWKQKFGYLKTFPQYQLYAGLNKWALRTAKGRERGTHTGNFIICFAIPYGMRLSLIIH